MPLTERPLGIGPGGPILQRLLRQGSLIAIRSEPFVTVCDLAIYVTVEQIGARLAHRFCSSCSIEFRAHGLKPPPPDPTIQPNVPRSQRFPGSARVVYRDASGQRDFSALRCPVLRLLGHEHVYATD